jgi:hypothetical protein
MATIDQITKEPSPEDYPIYRVDFIDNGIKQQVTFHANSMEEAYELTEEFFDDIGCQYDDPV